MNKIYFPNLNGLRFGAALLVIIYHIEQFKQIFGYHNYLNVPCFHIMGKLGVILFFVLSGFLITYLLLEEEKQTNTISIKDFYIRRILRIWPLYFLIVVASFFLLNKISYLQIDNLSSLVSQDIITKLALFTFFLPNIALVMFTPIPYASQLWSVGIEEQFYLIWPLLIKYTKQKYLILYVIIFGYVFMNVYGFNFIKFHFAHTKTLNLISEIWSNFSIDCMAIGGLFGMSSYYKKPMMSFLFKNYVQYIVLFLLIILISLGIRIPYIHYEFYAILFGIVIINLATNPKPIFSLNNILLNYLGKISYGLYMFHPIAIVLVLKLLKLGSINSVIIEYISCVTVTILLSSISYKYYEKHFITLKMKYSKILSGDNTGPILKS